MGKYFLIKERKYCKIDGSFRGQDRKLLGSYDDYDVALKNASQEPEEEGYKNPQDETVVYVVEIVAKCYSSAKCKSVDAPSVGVCTSCGWPSHNGECGSESIPKQ